MHYELYTLDGKVLLDHTRIHQAKKKLPALDFGEDLILSYKKREDSALFYQLDKVLGKEIKEKSASRFEKILFYVDFNSARPIEEETFSLLFNKGFHLNFNGAEPDHYVPFITSQSQSKKFVYSFVRADVFELIMPRLDLDLPLEQDAKNKSLAYLAKLYAYRALYMSSAAEALRCNDLLGNKFFNCDNIIVLPEKTHKRNVEVFTANSTKEFSKDGDAIICQQEATEQVELTCFDGAGIMSYDARDMIISRFGKLYENDYSFQIRMPFLKGVLHTVDFHKFIKEQFKKEKGIEVKEAFVKDVFGRKRDLFKANVIIRPSVFKLAGLIKSFFPSNDARDKYFANVVADGDIMKYYFQKLHEYNHGIYIVKSESSFKDTQYVHLSSQQLSTFDFSIADLDGIVAEHIAMANAFTAENLADPKKRKELLSVEDKTDWMQLLLKDERFLKDPHIRASIKAHRVSLLNDIALGKLLVKGENRFLCGDLYVFLADMLERIILDELPVFSDICKKFRKENKFLSQNAVYMPGADANGQKVALIRSPHLSRNEDVCTIIKSKNHYNDFLKHLTGVVFTGDTSFIPAALGGADFDGDHISIVYDRRIIDACHKSGYTEINKTKSAVPFIHIKEISVVVPPEKAKIKKYNYVCPRVVYTTFSNRIGQISNTAMKIAAIEYDPNLKKSKDLPSTAFCTILTGNEIDATKKGVRPYIDDVQKFSKSLDNEARLVVKEIENYIEMKRELKNKKGEVPPISLNEKGNLCLPEDSELPIKIFTPNREYNAVAQLLYRWAKAFYDFKEANEDEIVFDRKVLSEIFDTKPKKATLCKDIIAAFRSADTTFGEVSKKRELENEQLNKLAAMETVRLKGQYDNIYSQTENAISYKDKFEVFKKELLVLTKDIEQSEIFSLKQLLYSVDAEKFNAENFWPYTKDENLKEIALLKKILALPYAELLFNFDFEGYRLLHYALQEVIVRKKTVDFSKKANKNEYTKKYFDLCEKGLSDHISRTKFDRDLADFVLADLADAEGIYLWDQNLESELIARLYPQYDASLTNAFWKIFTEKEVLDVLGGKVNA